MTRKKAIFSLIFLAILTHSWSNPLIGARVYCKYGSALTTSPNGTALIEDLPAGQYLVTACAQGYKSKSQIVDVTTGDPVEPTFALESQSGGIILWLTADPERIPPDGTSTSTITAHVTDLEGAPLQDKSVTITTDMSTFQETSTGTVTGNTDNQGALSATLISLTTPNTATLTATCEGTTAEAYVEFASETAPLIRITSPVNGCTASDYLTLSAEADDALGDNPGVESLSFLLDGQLLDSTTPYESTTRLYTCELTNGPHVLQATAVDGDLEVGFSQVIAFDVNNAVESFLPDKTWVDIETPGQDTVTYGGHRTDSTNGPWQVEIWEAGGTSPVKTISGTGTTVSATWDGRDSSGNPVYGAFGARVILFDSEGLNTTSTSALSPCPIICAEHPGQPIAVVVDAIWDEPDYMARVAIVKATLRNAGFKVIYLNKPNATWDKFCNAMALRPDILYVHAHGAYKTAHTGYPHVTRFQLKDAMVMSHRKLMPDGSYCPYYPAPGANYPPIPSLQAHYVTELGGSDLTELRIAYMDGCYMGHIGTSAELDTWFEPYGTNDMAAYLCIYENAWILGASYMGYYHESSFYSADPAYAELPPTLFGAMSGGLTLWQTLNYYLDYPPFNSSTGPWRVCDNLRVFGNPLSTILGPM